MELSDSDMMQQPDQQDSQVDEPATTPDGLTGPRPVEAAIKKQTQALRRFSDSTGQIQYLDPRPTATVRPSADTLFSDLSLYTGDVSNGQRYGRESLRSPSPVPAEPTSELPSPRRRRSLRWIVLKAWLHSKGMLMVILSQFFGASMNVMTQILERDGSHGKAMHPFQILFTRMLITAAASYAYMCWGFFGVFGMYFSLLYMPLAEATVLTFLAPIVACYVCSFLMPNEPFTRRQQLAGIVSLLGVILIARPFSGGKVEDVVDLTPPSNSTMIDSSGLLAESITEAAPSAYQHLLAIGFSLVGVLGAACAYTTIRLIGTRAHALVSVTYFSTYSTLISIVAMIAIPSVSFRLPGNISEWGLLLGLGANGFTMQYLLTAGLAYKPPSSTTTSGHGTRATSMVYTQMLFALFYDKLVMDSTPSAISWAGSGLILGSALYVAIVRDSNTNMTTMGTVAAAIHADESRENASEMAGLRKDIEQGQALLAREPEITDPGSSR
ncbi:hypothetical protein BGW36DRAFT_427001 [Talaromyces proteolyticus]|uniref:EamA domain-containing protein n=1 Tax=Talaromyces proteolyticus TaxID=1131652 RepID=A0AAD4KQB9_9EURO|nr:uncharacterized protein BGW36DRAFT_427001 [Talaromyces proteolyticus]KAH8697025.1 hypothetical protein BGW36DRAFT_427001 [Talaromyces proteolyticus]